MIDNNELILKFYAGLDSGWKLPEGVELIYPYTNAEVLRVLKTFYDQYYNDNAPRRILFGINPGRFGSGVTGIPFTDPIRLEEDCGIPNDFEKRPELSSRLVYELIDLFGGPSAFYRRFYISAVCPLGFLKDGKNFNYYDSPLLYQSVKEKIVESIELQLDMGFDTERVFTLGKGQNLKYLRQLNDVHQWFGEIVPLPHPRWIMQYRRKQKDSILNEMVLALTG